MRAAASSAQVGEVSDQVNQLVVENRGKMPILAPAETVLEGGKQDRRLGEDLIAEAGKTVPVEAGSISSAHRFCCRMEWEPERIRSPGVGCSGSVSGSLSGTVRGGRWPCHVRSRQSRTVMWPHALHQRLHALRPQECRPSLFCCALVVLAALSLPWNFRSRRLTVKTGRWLIGMVAWAAALGAAAGGKDDLKAVYEAREYVAKDGGKLLYRLMRPKGYDATRKYPLVLVLHGAGGRGSDNWGQIGDQPLPFQQLASDALREKHPCFVVAPQCPRGKQWVNTPWGKGSYAQEKVPISAELKRVAVVRSWSRPQSMMAVRPTATMSSMRVKPARRRWRIIGALPVLSRTLGYSSRRRV